MGKRVVLRVPGQEYVIADAADYSEYWAIRKNTSIDIEDWFDWVISDRLTSLKYEVVVEETE